MNLSEELYKDLTEITVGNRIRKSRIINRMSQTKLGKLIGVNHSTIQDYESGMCYPSPSILIKIADILNKPIEYFYDDYYEFIFSNFSGKIKNWRIKNNLTLKEAGKITGIDYRALGNWESGNIMDRNYFKKIKTFLQM